LLCLAASIHESNGLRDLAEERMKLAISKRSSVIPSSWLRIRSSLMPLSFGSSSHLIVRKEARRR
jgi:hypothetical protein